MDPFLWIFFLVYFFYLLIFTIILSFFSYLFLNRTKWKRQTAVGVELFLEAGNYAAYQRAYASRFGQMEAMPSYQANPLMMPGAAHPMMTPANLPSVESYYQQIFQNGMNGIPASHANLFAAPHRPLPMVPQMPGAGFLPLSPPNPLYPASKLTNFSPSSHTHSPEYKRPNSLSPVASSPPSHSPKTSTPWTNKPESTHNVDDESDIEV